MRLNKYVHFIEAEGCCFLFDISTGYVLALNTRLYTVVQSHSCNIESLRHIHPALYEHLLSEKMIVEDDFNETEALIESYKAIDCDNRSFSIIINPTLDCNLRCWYCYETHARGSMMDEATMARVRKLIAAKVSSGNLQRLSLSFFGGEPLMGWRKVVMPLLEYAVDLCRKHNISFSTGFTTNGVMLTDEKFTKLTELGLVDTPFQISFDGNRILHNASRVGETRQPTYDRIMENVRNGASRGFRMNLRFNYTPDNLESFVDILSDLELLPDDAKANICCNFQKVWQSGDKATMEDSIRIGNLFREAGFETSCDINYWRHLCYADRENQVTINYNGDLYKCTAREFAPAAREGILTTDGKTDFNERYRHRMDIKYSNKSCRDCMILPLCNGRCSQGKLESGNDMSSCYLNYDDEMRRLIIRGALYHKAFGRMMPMHELKDSND